MKAITAAGEGRLNSFFIQNHSLSCRRERSLTKQHEAKKLRHCEDACMPGRLGRRKKADHAIDDESIRGVVRRTDSNPQLVATAKFLRGLIPGGDPETSEMPQAMQRLVEQVQPQGPSAMREIGKGALQAWQALSEAQRRR